MSKIKIRIKEKTKEKIIFEGFGIKIDHKLIYYDEKNKNEINIYQDNIEIIRTTNDSILTLNLDQKKPNAIYQLKEGTVELPISKVKISKKENQMNLKYQIDQELFEIEIEYQVIK